MKHFYMEGENPHQKAELIIDENVPKCSLFASSLLAGPWLNYNDLIDCDSALALMREFKEESNVVNLMYHHANPCGLTCNPCVEKGFMHMLKITDSTSIIEGMFITSGCITKKIAEYIVEHLYLHAIIAREYEKGTVEILKQHKQLSILELKSMFEDIPSAAKEIKQLMGGTLIQDYNTMLFDNLKFITSRHATKEELEQLLIAWKVVKHTKTNAIVLVKDKTTVGIAPGLNNRIWSVNHAIERAGSLAKGSVLASDAIIPLCESIEIAAKAQITAIIEPGGWYKEDENIEVANKYNIAMVTTGINQFKH